MSENQKISVITRTIKGRRDFLDQCLFSLYCSDYKNDLEVIIVCQTSDLEYFESIKDLQFLYERNNLNFKYIINPVDFDDRSNNLNLGIKASTGRYICFLDDDDIYYPNHISLLFNELSNSNKAWAYSNCCMHHNNDLVMENKTFPFKRPQFSFLDLWDDNYIPIHSWLIDTNKIKIPICFDSNLSKLEDYLFLLNLAFNHEPVFVNKTTHVYKVRIDGSNTICIGESSEEKVLDWEESRIYLQRQKRIIAKDIYWLNEAVVLKNEIELLTNERESLKFQIKHSLQLILKRIKSKIKKLFS